MADKGAERAPGSSKAVHGSDHGRGSEAEAASTYADAGVDISAGEAAVDRIRKIVDSTRRPEVLGNIGGFGGAFRFDPSRYADPVLVSSTDGVGTKALVAQATGRYDTIGIDLVAMCADDVVCSGAEPLFLLDYIVTSKLDPEQMEQLVRGVAEGCRRAGCALVGGEMAEHPGATLGEPGAFDLAGFCVGAVDRDRMLGPARVEVGDEIIGLTSPGLRSNGYSLARHVLFERCGRSLDDPAYDGASHSLADELMRPSFIYTPAVLEVLAVADVHAAAHVTGGGIAGNLARVMPDEADAVVLRRSFATPPIFSEIQRLGNVNDEEMAKVFNLGIGMLLVVSPDTVDEAMDALEEAGCEAVVVGSVVQGSGRARLEN